MAGNVLEWCADVYDPAAYEQYTQGDMALPSARMAAQGTIQSVNSRVVRGGSWRMSQPHLFQCAQRLLTDPTWRYDTVGFRCAQSGV